MSVEHIGKGYVKICVSEEELENSIAGLSTHYAAFIYDAVHGR